MLISKRLTIANSGPTVFAGTGLETSFGDLYGFSATVRHMSIKTDKFCTLLGLGGKIRQNFEL